MKINTDSHYFFRVTNMEDEDKHRYTLLIQDDYKMTLQTWKMNINTDTPYLLRMTNMEDEHRHRYTLLIQDDKHGR